MENKNSFEHKEQAPTLGISFSFDNEISRVVDTINKLPWYREHYGDSNARLPKGIDEQSSLDKVRNTVSVEFSQEAYLDYKKYILDEWQTVSSKLAGFTEMSSFHSLDSYSIRLTKYGSGGSYDAGQGLVIVNIELRSKEKIINTIIHEIVHIGIEHLVKKHSLTHWQKERLVDLIVDHYFPGMRKLQNIKEDVSVVDSAFNNFFPDLESTTKVITEK